MDNYGYGPPQQPQSPYGHAPYGQPEFDIYKRSIKWNANVIGASVALITICMYLASRIMGDILSFILLIVPSESHNFIYETTYMVIYILAFIIPCVVAIRWLGIPGDIAFPLRMPQADIMLSAIFIGLGARIAGNVLVNLMMDFVYSTTGLVPIYPETPVPTDIPSIIIYFISIAIMPAIFEEALFRGVALQSLRRFGDTFALVASSALFALMHGNLIQAAYSFPMGLVMGYFVLRTGSIWAGVIIHFMNNAFVVGIELFSLTAAPATADFAWNAFLTFSFLGSIAAILYLRFRYGAAFFIRPSRLPLPEGKKYQWFFSSIFVIISILIAIRQTVDYLE